LLVRRAVQDLNRPRAQDEEADRHPDDDRESADPDVEAGAPEVRRVDTRIGLEATAVRQVAREGYPAPGIWSGEAYGCGLRVGLSRSVGGLSTVCYSSASSSARSANARLRQARSGSERSRSSASAT